MALKWNKTTKKKKKPQTHPKKQNKKREDPTKRKPKPTQNKPKTKNSRVWNYNAPFLPARTEGEVNENEVGTNFALTEDAAGMGR